MAAKVRFSLSVLVSPTKRFESDGRVYIWHKENGALIETLEGHAGGCVNDVAWNPADSCMFASAGDDKKVRMYVEARFLLFDSNIYA